MTPIEVFEAAVQALHREDARGAAMLCDAVSLRAFKRQYLELVAPTATPFVVTAETFLQHAPTMPREVAEYQAAQHRQYEDPAERLQREFPSVSSVDALRALEPVDVFAAWLEGRSPRRQIARFIDAKRLGTEAVKATAAMDEHWYNYVALGVIHDGEDVAHVVYRQRVDATHAWEGAIAEQVAALPLDEQQLMRESWASGNLRFARCRRQTDESWCLHAGDDFLAVGSISIAGMAPRSKGESDNAS